MKTLARPALRSAATSISTMAGVRIRALTERHPIQPTSRGCHSAWQLNLGRHSTYRRGKSVQTTGTTSVRVRGYRLPRLSVLLHQLLERQVVTFSLGREQHLLRDLIEAAALGRVEIERQ